MVEVDDTYFGGHSKSENVKVDCKDHCLTVPAKLQSIVVIRERGGWAITWPVARVANGVILICANAVPGSTVCADEAVR